MKVAHIGFVIDKSRQELQEEKEVLQRIGDEIKKLRLEKGLSQYELAIDAKITENQIGRIERAEINTSILNLYNIAKALDVDIRELI